MDRISKALARAKETRQFKPRPPDQQVATEINTAFAGARHVDVPHDFLRKMKILADGEADQNADAYKLLRTRVMHSMEEKGWVTIGITSPQPRAGKTLTSINLALAIARSPKYSVILVDADLRNPSVHRLFGIETEKGLAEFLTSDEELNGFLLCPGIERFAILPTVRKVAGTSELLASKRMQSLIAGFRQRAGSLIVIFDLSPVLVADDVVVISSQLDTVLMVVEDGGTKRADLQRSLELLKHVNLLGPVLNKAKNAQAIDYDYYA
jgi:capsular exopolysaccharide synthesis family protein